MFSYPGPFQRVIPPHLALLQQRREAPFNHGRCCIERLLLRFCLPERRRCPGAGVQRVAFRLRNDVQQVKGVARPAEVVRRERHSVDAVLRGAMAAARMLTIRYTLKRRGTMIERAGRHAARQLGSVDGCIPGWML